MGIFSKKQPPQGRRTPGVALGRNRAVYSYRQNRMDTSESPVRKAPADYKKKAPLADKRKFLRNIPTIVGCVVIILSVLYLTVLTPQANVRVVEEDAPGAVLLKETEVYKEAAGRILASSPLNRSKFSFDSSKVARQLEQEFPELSSTSVVVPIIGSKPTFVIRPINPSFMLSSNNQTYIINEFGVAVAPIDKIPDSSKLTLTTVIDKSGVALEQNKAVLSDTHATFISSVIAQLKAKNIAIKNIVLPLSPYDLQVRLKDKNYFVRMNMQGDAKLQVGSFLAVKRRVDKGSMTVREYIDVRVDERVYYK